MALDERRLADVVYQMDCSKRDRADEVVFNRLLWIDSGMTSPDPAGFAGPHGRGLAALRLQLDKTAGRKKADDD